MARTQPTEASGERLIKPKMKQTLRSLKNLFIQRLNFQAPEETEAQFFRLLESFFQITRLDYLKNSDSPLAEHQKEKLMKALAALENNQPVQHILGTTSFAGLTLRVNANVLIPRPETEELLVFIKEQMPDLNRAIDVGTGSGCIALALAQHYKNAQIWATDLSSLALSLAQENALDLGLSVNFLENNVLTASRELPQDLDLIVSNPPYIRQSEKRTMAPNVVNYEPHLALFVEDEDPLIFYRAIADYAQKALRKEGLLAFEINQYLAPQTCTLLEQKGFKARFLEDSFGNARFVLACL